MEIYKSYLTTDHVLSKIVTLLSQNIVALFYKVKTRVFSCLKSI